MSDRPASYAMQSGTDRRADFVIPLVAALLFAGLYALTVTNHITQDSITYAASAVRGGLASWLHPHHLVYNVLLAGVVRIVGTTAANEAALATMQGFNVIVS